MKHIIIYQTETSIGRGNLSYYKHRLQGANIVRMLLYALEDSEMEALNSINGEKLIELLLSELDNNSGTIYSN